MSRQLSAYELRFNEAYGQLNDYQKLAVDKIDGPVMVIAGPGTGKTQLLAVRIGKILEETQTSPHQILCLTFTEAATIAMRNRLVEIIGPVGHKIHIYTFHGFCNQIIQENLNVFGSYRQLDLLSDLEKIELFDQIIEELPAGHILKNVKSPSTYEARRLENLFSMMKRENLTVERIKGHIEEYLSLRLADKDDKELYYQRKFGQFSAGDLKTKQWDSLNRKMNELSAGAELYSVYESKMKDLDRYDYQDMILWVIREFEQSEDLLTQYQERYQYFLVDEFQDTNGAQKDILEALISYWQDFPNVFLVGDDDQAIYKFQGANVENIEDFFLKYKPYTVLLNQNYRSSQLILDSSSSLIRYNQGRLVNNEELNLDKSLEASNAEVQSLSHKPTVLTFPNIIQEQAYIFRRLKEIFEERKSLQHLAVIYRKHSQVERLVSALEKAGIPLNVRKRVDILGEPLITRILHLMRFVSGFNWDSKPDEELFILLHYNFFGINHEDIVRLICFMNTPDPNSYSRIRLLPLIGNPRKLAEIGVSDIASFTHVSSCLHRWGKGKVNMTIQSLFEDMINRGGILNHILSNENKSWYLQLLTSFFDFIKSETSRNSDMQLDEFVQNIDRMISFNIPIFINKVINSENGAHFLTAHSSKGLEFDEVYIPGTTANIWDKSVRNFYQYSYPESINKDAESDIEDERRLFFVAMTRAKSKLWISYALKDDNGKDIAHSQFLDEMFHSDTLESRHELVDDEHAANFQIHYLSKPEIRLEFIDHDAAEQVLNTMKLSVTGVNKYLKCPLSFYFESVLRVPTARTMHMGFGRAMHHALQHFYLNISGNKRPGCDTLLQCFEEGMNMHKSHFTPREYNDLTIYGHQVLKSYYGEKLSPAQGIAPQKVEIKLDNAEYKGVPLKGIIDRVDVFDSFVEVTDYKTGKWKNSISKLQKPKASNPLGGDYWRQIVFYKLLLDSDKKYNWTMSSGTVEFIEPDAKTGEFYAKRFEIDDSDIDIVGEQIVSVWEKINNHEFTGGCGEKNCKWCQFVNFEMIQKKL